MNRQRRLKQSDWGVQTSSPLAADKPPQNRKCDTCGKKSFTAKFSLGSLLAARGPWKSFGGHVAREVRRRRNNATGQQRNVHSLGSNVETGAGEDCAETAQTPRNPLPGRVLGQVKLLCNFPIAFVLKEAGNHDVAIDRTQL